MRIGPVTLSLILVSAVAQATVEGNYPDFQRPYEVFGDREVTGNTLMFSDGRVNLRLAVGGSSGSISSIPRGATIEAGFLFWSGSIDQARDEAVHFTMPDGTTHRDLHVARAIGGEDPQRLQNNSCYTRTFFAGQPVNFEVNFGYCRRDITDLLRGLGTSVNGTYHVDGLDALAGWPTDIGNVGTNQLGCANSGQVEPRLRWGCQAMYAGWSMVIIWSHPDQRVRREIVLYDGFLLLDDDSNSGGIKTFTISQFEVGEQARGEFAFFGLEGDNNLGSGQEQLPENHQYYCRNCPDFVAMRTDGNPVETQLFAEPGNSVGNLWNGSISVDGGGVSTGVDLDIYDVGVGGLNIIREGDREATFRMGTGDGRAGTQREQGRPVGGGELVFLGWSALSLDVRAPNLNNNDTVKLVSRSEAGPGDTLEYQVVITNDGSASATAVTITDPIPTGTTYIAGSTATSCGVDSPDVGGQSPLVSGLNLGTLLHQPRISASCTITFLVRVNDNAAAGDIIRNSALVRSAEQAQFSTDQVQTRIVGPTLGTPLMVAIDNNGGAYEINDQIRYRIRIPNEAGSGASGIVLTSRFPTQLGDPLLIAPDGVTMTFDPGTRLLVISNITVPGDRFQEINILTSIRSGEPPLVSHQMALTAPFLINPLLTDDPNVPGAFDPTEFGVVDGPNLTTSSKLGEDVNGAPLVPGDQVRYTITLANTGNREATFTLVDSLQAPLTGCTVQSFDQGLMQAACAGADLSVSGRLPAGETRTVVILAAVGNAPDGTLVRNQATLTVTGEVPQILTSPNLFVAQGGVLVTSLISAVDIGGAPLTPGDQVELRFTARNSGGGAVRSLVIRTILDARLSAGAISDGGQGQGATITWTNLGDLAVGASRTVTVVVTVAAGLPRGTTIPISAVFRADTLADFSPEPVLLIIDAGATLSFEKTVDPPSGGQYNPGEAVRYLLTVRNTALVPAENLVISDEIPAGLVQVAAAGGGSISDGVALWTAQTTPALAQLAAGASIELVLTARIASPMEDRREIANQARLSGSDILAILSDDPNTVIGDDPTVIVVRSETALVLEKSDAALGESPYEPGTQVRYRLRVGAGGTQRARGLVLSDTLPEGVSYVSSQPAGRIAGRTITWTAAEAPALGNLSPGDEVVLTVVVQIDPRAAAGAEIRNQAQVTGETHNGAIVSNDPDTPAVDDPTLFFVGGAPALVVQKTVQEEIGDGLWRIGEQVRYRISIENAGSTDALNISIVDPIDPNLTDVQVEGGWGRLSNGQISGQIDRLRHDADPVVLTFTARLAAAPNGTSISNQAQVQVAGAGAAIPSDDPTRPGPADATIITLTAEEGVSLLKEVEDLNGGTVLPGDSLRYLVTLTNTGQTPIGALAVLDEVDVRLTGLALGAGMQGSIDGQTIRWTVGGLDPGQSVQGRFIVRVADDVGEGVSIANQASVVYDGESILSDDGVVGNDDPTPTFVIVGAVPQPAIQIAKTVSPSEQMRGGEVVWSLAISNSGEGDLVAGALEDLLPEGLEILEVGGAEALGRRVSASLDIAAGEQLLVTIRTRLLPSAPDSLENQASIRWATGEARSDDPRTVQLGDPTSVTVLPAPLDPLLEKTAVDLNGEPLQPGDEVEYRIVLRNRGTEALPAMTLVDLLDGPITFVEDSFSVMGTPQPGPYPLTQGAPIAAGLQPGQSIDISFHVRVGDDVEIGTLISNQAVLSDASGNRWSSDDPLIPGGPQPTVLQVGAAGAVSAVKTVSPSAIARGESAAWQIELFSSANGTRTVRLEDIIPAGLTYEAGSLSLDGAPLTDAQDGDDASFDPGVGRITLTLELGPQRRRAVLAFRTEASGSNRTVLNQALLDINGVTGLSDADPTAPGLQATALIIRPDGAALEGEKIAIDLNGGTVQPGDSIRYEVRLRNRGDEDLVIPAGGFADPLSRMTYEDGSADPAVLTLGDGTLRNTEAIDVAAGGSAILRFMVRLDPDLEEGQAVVNTATISDPVDWSGEARLIIGSPAPGATLQGSVFLSGAPQTKLKAWQVLVRNALDHSEVLTATTDDAGVFAITGIGWSTVDLEVLSAAGTSFYRKQLSDLSDGEQRTQDCPIDPSGVIYDIVTGVPIAGARVEILYDGSGDPVLDDDLPAGQQGQITGADGFYRFDVLPPHIYRLEVTPPGVFHSFPSQVLRPLGASSARLLGRPSRMSQSPDKEAFFIPKDEAGEELPGRSVVAEPIPDPAQRMTYFLRFDIQSDADAVFHNHVPLDPLRKQVRLSRIASKSEAAAGDLVTFIIEVENRSDQHLGPELDGGIELLDLLPPGLMPLRGADGAIKEAFEKFDAQGARAVLRGMSSTGLGALRSLSGLRLAPGEKLRWHYRVQVSGSAAAGVVISESRLLTAHGRMPVAEPAQHRLILRDDPLLRTAPLIGRVYCDRNGDDHPGAGEDGVPGARIYADNGVRVDSDASGRFHFSRLSPGLHRFKLDLRSLAPGLGLIGAAGQNRLITPGVPVTLDYRVGCPKELSRADEVMANPLAEGAEPPPPPQPPAKLEVVVDVVAQQTFVDGIRLFGPQVEAAATAIGEDPSFDLPQGPNLDAVATGMELHARVAGPLPLASWRWRVTDSAGAEVMRRDGSGAPPPILTWAIPDQLKRDARYEAVLSVHDAGGDSAVSRVIPIGLGLGLPGADKRNRMTKINEVNGRLFLEDGATPTPRLRGWFNDRIARLRGEAELMVEVFVYGAAYGKANKAQAWTERRARSLEGMLLASGLDRSRFAIHPMGNRRKLAPERNKRLRKLNRRIEIRFKAIAADHPPIEPEAPPVAHVVVAGVVAVIDEHGRAVHNAPIPVGHFLRIDSVFASGARSVLRRLRHTDGLASKALVPDRRGVPVSGRLRGDRGLTIGDQKIDLSALSLRLRPMLVAVELNAAGDALAAAEGGPQAICVGICFGTSSDLAMTGWELRIFSHSIVVDPTKKSPDDLAERSAAGRLVHKMVGVGPVPPVVSWDGKNPQGSFILNEGIYSARLIARAAGGLTGLSRPVNFRAYRPRQDFRVVLTDPFGKLKRKKKLPKMRLSGDTKRDFERFIRLAKVVSGSIELTGHTDLTLRATRAQVMSLQMADAVRAALVASGIDEGRIIMRGLGSARRLVERARKGRDHARNRRVELVLKSDELPSLPALRSRIARLHSPAGDLVAQRDGSLEGSLFPDASGRVTVQIEDGSGRAAKVPLDLDLGPKIPDLEVVVVIPAVTADGAALPETDALSLRVQLPNNGAVLAHEGLGLFGQVAVGVRVRVDGKLVAVHPLSGRFGAALRLKPGEHTIVVEAEDDKGHRTRLQRTVTVKPSGRVLMALLDIGYQTAAAKLPGLLMNRSLDLGSYGRVGGRAMVWYKERWQRGDDSFFKRIRLNTFIDTDRAIGEFFAFDRDSFNLRLLPAEFGDDAVEVAEVKAAGPVFIDLRADASRFRLANFKTDLPGRTVLKYQRAFYGLDLVFDHQFGPKKQPNRVVVQAYASDTAAGLRSATNLLRATGSSFYRLRHRDVVPGTERVEVVVRDAASGLVLLQRSLRRGSDYRLDATEGLLVLSSPLPSSAGLQMASSYGVSTSDLSGHPVFIAVAYSHRDAERLASFATGGRVDGASKRYGLKGGVSYAYEGRADGSDAFQAAGVFGAWRHKKGHRASAEFAWSRSIDGDHYASSDGGNSFFRIGEDNQQAAIDFNGRLYPTSLNAGGSPRTGIGWKLDTRLMAGTWLGKKKKEDATFDAYVRQVTPGFYGGGAVLDQGQTRWGALSTYRISKIDRASLRYDASYSLVSAPVIGSNLGLPNPAIREYRRIHREALTMRWQRAKKRWTLGAQYQLGYTGDSWNYVDTVEGTRASVLSNSIAADGLYKINKKWTVGGAQRIIISGDDLRLVDPFSRLSTAARARYALAKKLAIEVEDELRWNGDNQARFSLVRRPHKKLEQYVQERLVSQSGGFFNTTVLGAMERPKKGVHNRAEVHMDHALGQERMSGVVGLGRRYKVLPGLTLALDYERFQVLSGGPALASPSPITGDPNARGSAGRAVGTSDLVGQPTPPNLGTPLLQSGMNGWGLAPVTGSRDVVALSFKYKRRRKLTVIGRSELRLELAQSVDLEDALRQDRLIHFNEIGGRLRLSPDLTILGRFALAEVRNMTTRRREHLANEVSFALALRPTHTDQYRGLLRYTRHQDLRADQRWLTKDLLAFEPIFRTPWYLQLATKFALKADAESDPLLGDGVALTALVVPRLDFELTKLLRRQRSMPLPGNIELWGEYRLLADLGGEAMQHGVALGLSYLPIKHLRIGLGYSFTAVPAALTTADTVDGSGFFMRITGLY